MGFKEFKRINNKLCNPKTTWGGGGGILNFPHNFFLQHDLFTFCFEVSCIFWNQICEHRVYCYKDT